MIVRHCRDSFDLENEIFGPSVAEAMPEVMMDEDHLVIDILPLPPPPVGVPLLYSNGHLRIGRKLPIMTIRHGGHIHIVVMSEYLFEEYMTLEKSENFVFGVGYWTDALDRDRDLRETTREWSRETSENGSLSK
ncbi:hypothetical protein BDV93DRAFT_510792 [Ceratobasidium sp. AG-I]|nr:hypothetical protein BDV93DRAFT_510792 [Ceratobasidium sp. AG-I]